MSREAYAGRRGGIVWRPFSTLIGRMSREAASTMLTVLDIFTFSTLIGRMSREASFEFRGEPVPLPFSTLIGRMSREAPTSPPNSGCSEHFQYPHRANVS